MQAVKANRTPLLQSSTNRLVPIAIILLILAVLALYGLNTFRAFHPASLPQDTVVISQSALEQQYGLRVNLLAVTAAGGMVDLRLKITDGDKLKLLLSDAKNFPVLVTGRGVTINAPEDTKSQKIQFVSGGSLFIIYPNSGNAIKQGEPVTILFGDIALEPTNAE